MKTHRFARPFPDRASTPTRQTIFSQTAQCAAAAKGAKPSHFLTWRCRPTVCRVQLSSYWIRDSKGRVGLGPPSQLLRAEDRGGETGGHCRHFRQLSNAMLRWLKQCDGATLCVLCAASWRSLRFITIVAERRVDTARTRDPIRIFSSVSLCLCGERLTLKREKER